MPRHDDELDRLLTRSLRRHDRAAEVCPDADVLASFGAGELDRGERIRIERHVSSCARCVQVLALAAQAEPQAPRDLHGGGVAAWWRWRWMVPAATAATVAGLWFASSSPEIRRPSAPSAVVSESRETPPPAASGEAADPETRLADARSQSAVPPAADTPAMPRPAAPAVAAAPIVRQEPAAPGQERREEASARSMATASPRSPQPAVPESAEDRIARRAEGAPAPAAAAEGLLADRSSEPRRDGFAPEILARSPDARAIWRRAGNGIERSTDGGATWSLEYTADRPITAGGAVSEEVAWFAGAGGVVLRRTASGWSTAQPPVPEAAIAAIAATSATSAIVTLADGRQFETQNGGNTWQPRTPPKE